MLFTVLAIAVGLMFLPTLDPIVLIIRWIVWGLLGLVAVGVILTFCGITFAPVTFIILGVIGIPLFIVLIIRKLRKIKKRKEERQARRQMQRVKEQKNRQ